MVKKLLFLLFNLALLLFLPIQVKAEYTEIQLGSWFALMDDTDQSQPKTAYIAKSSFTRHVTNVVLDNATLHIGCQGAKNFIFFDFDVPIKNDQSKKYNVEFQLDEGKINKSKWVLSSNLKALIVEKPEVFIKNLLKTSLILVKIEPENSSAETSETIESYFNISDLKDSFKFVQENCQWK